MCAKKLIEITHKWPRRAVDSQIGKIYAKAGAAAEDGLTGIRYTLPANFTQQMIAEIINALCAEGFDAFWTGHHVVVNWLEAAEPVKEYRIVLLESKVFGKGRPGVPGGYFANRDGDSPYTTGRSQDKSRAIVFTRDEAIKETEIMKSLGYPFKCEPPIYLITRL